MRLGQFTNATAERPWSGVITSTDDVVNLPIAGEAAGLDLPR